LAFDGPSLYRIQQRAGVYPVLTRRVVARYAIEYNPPNLNDLEELKKEHVGDFRVVPSVASRHAEEYRTCSGRIG
jgi:hypothetical protein